MNAITRSGKTYYQTYVDAAWGLKNYWYPALFSHELDEGEVKGVKIAGEAIALRRAKGRVYALRDRCLHRGVRLSARPTCLTDDTLTCWYHGFTYDLATGCLKGIVAAPEDEMIGKVRLATFPVEEVNGMIFVFVREDGYGEVPPLSDDLPARRPPDYAHRTAHPLDADCVLLGIHRTIKSNWRLAAENGIDPGHVMMHRHSSLVLAREMAFPLGEKPLSDKAIQLIEGPGPKGVEYLLDAEYIELVLENREFGLSNVRLGANPLPGLRTILYLPCILAVENWPTHGLVQYEWYVPIDDKTHEYWQVLALNCPTEEERRDFEFKFKNMWEPVALRGFNDDDIFAREEMQPFYEDGTGWTEEQMCSLDRVLGAWRGLVARHVRKAPHPAAASA